MKMKIQMKMLLRIYLEQMIKYIYIYKHIIYTLFIMLEWRYDGSNTDGIIDVIYCSSIDLNIPVKYNWTVLLKNGTEYDLYDSSLEKKFKKKVDKDAYNKAKLLN